MLDQSSWLGLAGDVPSACPPQLLAIVRAVICRASTADLSSEAHLSAVHYGSLGAPSSRGAEAGMGMGMGTGAGESLQ